VLATTTKVRSFMDKQSMMALLKDQSLLDKYSLDTLIDLSMRYPHFSPLKMLMAKKAKAEGAGETHKIIKNVAFGIADRPQLFALLHNEEQSQVLTEKEETISSISDQPEKSIFDDTYIPSYPNPELPAETKTRKEVETDLATLKLNTEEKSYREVEMSKEEVLELVRFEVLEDLQRLKAQQDAFVKKKQDDNDYIDDETLERIELNEDLIESIRAKIEKFSFKNNINQEDIHPENMSSEEIRNLMLTDQENLKDIEKFLSNSEMPEKVVDPPKDTEYTETMALLYERQGNFSKAIEVYEQLKLKYPQKSIYFAHRIEVLLNSDDTY